MFVTLAVSDKRLAILTLSTPPDGWAQIEVYLRDDGTQPWEAGSAVRLSPTEMLTLRDAVTADGVVLKWREAPPDIEGFWWRRAPSRNVDTVRIYAVDLVEKTWTDLPGFYWAGPIKEPEQP